MSSLHTILHTIRERAFVRLERHDRWLTPHGISPFVDLRRRGLMRDPRTIIDVGAHLGESVLRYHALFPEATIHSFEPLAATYAELARAVGDDPRMQTHQLALSSRQGEASINTSYASTMGVMDSSPIGFDNLETIRIETLDGFMLQAGISHVDYLKIDAEGHDLQVLIGAADALADAAISLVEVEAGIQPENSLQVPLEDLKAHLENAGYRLFGIYEQRRQFKLQFLNRANLVFIAPGT